MHGEISLVRGLPLEISGFYNLPGEGVLVELRDNDDQTMLFNRQGLQYRIVHRKQQGIDTSAEEKALAQMNTLTTPQAL